MGRGIGRGRAARAAAIALVGALLAACSGGSGDEASDSGTLTFWTVLNTPDRLAVQQAVAQRFTEQTGIEVDVVGLAAADMNQALVSGAASGDVPDVILHGNDQTTTWASQGLLDTELPAKIVEELGSDTFSPAALELVTVDGELASVPSDGWGEMLFYRSDWFEQAGLEAPDSLQSAVAAAEALNEPGRAGIALGTKPGDPYTMQTLEALALANGCHLTQDGQVALDSPECTTALTAYQDLAAASVPGDQDVETTRAAYLSGSAAMVMWSPHLLDEIAGLVPDFPVTCPECADDPTFLAENTGVVALLSGPDNPDGAQYGLTLNLGLPAGAGEDARAFVEFLLDEGYEDFLSTATEGRFPLRSGTSEEPTKFADAWAQLPIGVDEANRAPMSELYGADVIDLIREGASGFDRWGFTTGAPELAGALNAQGDLVSDIGVLFSGGDPAAVAEQMARIATEVQADLG